MSAIVHFKDDTFQQEVLQSDIPVLVDFWAEWCGPCHMIAPFVEQISDEYQGRVKVGKLNVDENPRTASSFGIRGIPTLLLFKGGKAVEQIIGAVPKAQIKSRLDAHL
ncbi:MAG: thioredoxin TrxA [Candidatus Zixiibacteriota bacterium]|nr:MAG: thioredoxin TrxA [candidate division Zixibacteria bacterium]